MNIQTAFCVFVLWCIQRITIQVVKDPGNFRNYFAFFLVWETETSVTLSLYLFLKRFFSKLIFEFVKIKLNFWNNCHETIIVLREDKTSCKWSFRRFTYGNLVTTSPSSKQRDLLSFSQWQATKILRFHLFIQSVGATGGVYKGQGLIQRKVMTCAYKEFLVQNK